MMKRLVLAEARAEGPTVPWQLRYTVECVMGPPPLLVRNDWTTTRQPGADTLGALAAQKFIPAGRLPQECQELLQSIGPLYEKEPFWLGKRIQNSLDNDGWCARTLKEKKKQYLRIEIVAAEGVAPGSEFVLEIWPPGSKSPIHDHGDVFAAIKALTGKVDISIYPFLSPQNPRPHTQLTLATGQITYLQPRLNQVHKLNNPSRDKVCVTIQAYRFETHDKRRCETFDYINEEKGQIEHFKPKSDWQGTYEEFIDMMRDDRTEAEHIDDFVDRFLHGAAQKRS